MKKFLCMMMAVLMVLAMAACGGEPANNGGNDTPDATTVKIGGIGPLTGAYANYGLSEKNGAELAVKEINEAGGIAGKQIELSYQDSQGESESAVNAYGKLMDWGMEVSLGCVLSGENASVVAAARDDDVLLITPSGSADKCIDGNDKAFRVCFYDSYQGAAAAQYIKDNNMVDTVGILYQSDNDYSVGLYNAFVAKCGELGITIAETQTFTSSTNTDFSTQAARWFPPVSSWYLSPFTRRKPPLSSPRPMASSPMMFTSSVPMVSMASSARSSRILPSPTMF